MCLDDNKNYEKRSGKIDFNIEILNIDNSREKCLSSLHESVRYLVLILPQYPMFVISPLAPAVIVFCIKITVFNINSFKIMNEFTDNFLYLFVRNQKLQINKKKYKIFINYNK